MIVALAVKGDQLQAADFLEVIYEKAKTQLIGSSTFIVLLMVVVLGGTDAEGIEAATRSFTMIALRAPQLGPGNVGLFAETATPRTTGTPPGGLCFGNGG